MNVFNVCLLPDENYAKSISDYSQGIAKNNDAVYVLGDKSFAHMTVLQFETNKSEQEIADLFERYDGRRVFNININKMVVNPAKDGIVSCDIGVDVSDALINLQKEIIKHFKRTIKMILNKIDEDYYPHFTVTMIKTPKDKIIKMPEVPKELVKQNNIACRLSLGLSGSNYQVVKVY
ncbi:MAG: hypothetical protein LBL47_04030 [Lactobacillus sp.]|jgi:2'-5' RNA ligase|nr:hypothetical protein [Lactobacillus sp.]